jgi:hypothetical protein
MVGSTVGSAAAQGVAHPAKTQTFQAQLAQLNSSGASGTLTITLQGDQATVHEHVTGLVAGQPHAQHFHFSKSSAHTCPAPTADSNNDGIISTLEGVDDYGHVKLSLTKSGSTNAKNALAVKNYPTASGGTLTYTRTVTLKKSLLTALKSGEIAVVVHGIDANHNGKYDTDAGTSPLAKKLLKKDHFPLEATAPAACGILTASVSPTASGNGNSPVPTTSSSDNSGGNIPLDIALGLGSLGTLLGIISLAMIAKVRKA